MKGVASVHVRTRRPTSTKPPGARNCALVDFYSGSFLLSGAAHSQRLNDRLGVYTPQPARQPYVNTKAGARLVHSRHVDNLAAGILAELDLSLRNY